MENCGEVSASSYNDDHKSQILNDVASSSGFFKSQQIGEKDLSFEEKWKIAEKMLENNVPLFLQRYWKFINAKDVEYFECFKGDYQVNFYLSEIIKLQDSKTRKVRVKNRRYEALQSLIIKGSYFSEGEMSKRSPLLFEQLVGQYLSETERSALSREDADYKDSFASFLMRCLDKRQENFVMEQQQNEEDSFLNIEEEDDDSNAESEESECEVEDKPPPSDSEKEMLRNEFRNIMYENFLAGKDPDFDYSTVDDNTEYDSVDIRGLDEEEKYFDEESPQIAEEDMECEEKK